MKIIHKLSEEHARELDQQQIADRKLSFFLVSKRGHYFAQSADPDMHISNLHGWFSTIERDDGRKTGVAAGERAVEERTAGGYTLYKTIDAIRIDKRPTRVKNHLTSIERISDNTKEEFILTKHGLVYSVDSYFGDIMLDLDFREIFDMNDRGRVYAVSLDGSHPDVAIIEYTKYTDDTLTVIQHQHYLAIKGIRSFKQLQAWEKRNYTYDASRGSSSELYIYRALAIACKDHAQLIFAHSSQRDVALHKVLDIEQNLSFINDVHTQYRERVLEPKLIALATASNVTRASKSAAFAYVNAVHALDGMSVRLPVLNKQIVGLWAGLPWFFQFWARDELISLHALFLEGRYDDAKHILLRHLDQIMPDGRLPNRFPPANLGNADGIGWLFKRLQDFMHLCERRGTFDHYFTLYDIQYIRKKLAFSIKALQEQHLDNHELITHGPLESWMDTAYVANGTSIDVRDGARIEIQAQFLCMLQFMNQLNLYLNNRFVKRNGVLVASPDVPSAAPAVSPPAVPPDYKRMEMRHAELVRELFFCTFPIKNVQSETAQGGFLRDGYSGDMNEVTRPNMFLAYYLYPDLLHPREWEQAFDDALSRLWCEWPIVESPVAAGNTASGTATIGGGLSTIDKHHHLYHAHYTGQDNRSYHRGDSWFWINNLAAVALHRVNKHKYAPYIEKIMNASSEDILFSGYIGYASELTSSGLLTPGGCFCQTWSIATYIELIHELYFDE